MLLDPRAPVIAGCLLFLALVGWLTWERPMPGALASAHGRVPELATLEGCSRCHTRTGASDGCLECHEEIRAQHVHDRGLHGAQPEPRRSDCSACHSEHFGSAFELVNTISWGHRDPGAVAHAHVHFALEGAHEALECRACHALRDRSITLSGFRGHPRERTFLGLDQRCTTCHVDPHDGGLSEGCEACHGQDRFRPAEFFRHEEVWALQGGHSNLSCEACHTQTSRGAAPAASHLPFHLVEGRECAGCHETPHRAPFDESCESCHREAEPTWEAAAERLSAAAHSLTGFPLETPHRSVPCASCHARGVPYDRSHPDPSLPGYRRRADTCEGCHEDVHGGQFLTSYASCLDCHERTRFEPATFGLRSHERVWPLSEPHSAVPCTSCHAASPDRAREFVGTSRLCKSCHTDPHGGQFAQELSGGDCTACHEALASSFRIRPYDHGSRTGHELRGAHARAACDDCHAAQPVPAGSGPIATPRRYRGTPTSCQTCHDDVHRGQFQNDDGVGCERCHESFETWTLPRFDHDRKTRFPLDATHARAACESCHPQVALPGGDAIVQYRPLGTECRDCHDLPTRR